jgi:hypothetical protein
MILQILTAGQEQQRRATLHQLRARLGQVRQMTLLDAIEAACRAHQGHEQAIRYLVPAIVYTFVSEDDQPSKYIRHASELAGENPPYDPGAAGDEFVPLIPILVDEVILWQKSGQLHDGLVAALYDQQWEDHHHQNLMFQAIQIRDWIVGARPRLDDLGDRHPFYEAITRSALWHAQRFTALARGETQRQLPESQREPVLYRWPDGWHVVRLATKEHFAEEGRRLEHCVEGYANTLPDPRRRVLSLRKPNGEPVMTVEQRQSHFLGKAYPEGDQQGLAHIERVLESEHVPLYWQDRQARGKRNMLLVGRYEKQARRMLSCGALDPALDPDRTRPYQLWSADGGATLPLTTMAELAERRDRPQWLQWAAENRLWALCSLQGVFGPWSRLTAFTRTAFACVVSPATTKGFAAIPLRELPREQRALQEMIERHMEVETQKSKLWWVVGLHFDVDLLLSTGYLGKDWRRGIAFTATWGPLVFEHVVGKPRNMSARDLADALRGELKIKDTVWLNQVHEQGMTVEGRDAAGTVNVATPIRDTTDVKLAIWCQRGRVHGWLPFDDERRLAEVTRLAMAKLHELFILDDRGSPTRDDRDLGVELTFISRQDIPSVEASVYERRVEEIYDLISQQLTTSR